MSRMRLELAVVVAVIGVSAAYFASQTEETPEASGARSPRATSSACIARGGSSRARFGRIPCTVDLRNGQLDLVFKNDTDEDYDLYEGGGMGRYRIAKASRQSLEIAAQYTICAMTVEHNCFHYQIFSVPAGQSKTMHLGQAPGTLKGYPAQLPGIYITAGPTEGRFSGRIRRQ